MFEDKILVLDFGSQYSQLIARRIRETKVYSEILPYNVSIKKIRDFKPKGIILSGGPNSVYDEGAPVCTKEIFDLEVPILGICYGMQIMAHIFGATVGQAQRKEYGRAELNIIDGNEPIFKGLSKNSIVWMSHGDKVDHLPEGFTILANTESSPLCAISHKKRRLYGLQFHPEVSHTINGTQVLWNFAHNVCGCNSTWEPASFIAWAVSSIQEQVADKRVICALSGGVDSSVCAMLLHRAIGKNLHCIFVDNGLLRKNEKEKVVDTFEKHFDMNLKVVDGSQEFLRKLRDVVDPEQKRKIIGRQFIEVFEREAAKIEDAEFLAQGTLYPDVIESVSFKGPSATIKSHHNVGGLPEVMKLKLVEPLRELFKDEVRAIGAELGLPDDMCYRQPFPGPGLAIRCLGEVTGTRLEILKDSDKIVIEEIKKAGLYRDIWQSFAVLLPVKSVGVMGDERTYENTVALRAVNSVDGMTADWVKLPYEVLGTISNRLINEVKGVNRVVYDITSKPPGTIEWE